MFDYVYNQCPFTPCTQRAGLQAQTAADTCAVIGPTMDTFSSVHTRSTSAGTAAPWSVPTALAAGPAHHKGLLLGQGFGIIDSSGQVFGIVENVLQSKPSWILAEATASKHCMHNVCGHRQDTPTTNGTADLLLCIQEVCACDLMPTCLSRSSSEAASLRSSRFLYADGKQRATGWCGSGLWWRCLLWSWTSCTADREQWLRQDRCTPCMHPI